MLIMLYAGSLILFLICIGWAYNRGYQRRDRELSREREKRVGERLVYLAAPTPLSQAQRDHADAPASHLTPLGRVRRS